MSPLWVSETCGPRTCSRSRRPSPFLLPLRPYLLQSVQNDLAASSHSRFTRVHLCKSRPKSSVLNIQHIHLRKRLFYMHIIWISVWKNPIYGFLCNWSLEKTLQDLLYIKQTSKQMHQGALPSELLPHLCDTMAVWKVGCSPKIPT